MPIPAVWCTSRQALVHHSRLPEWKMLASRLVCFPLMCNAFPLFFCNCQCSFARFTQRLVDWGSWKTVQCSPASFKYVILYFCTNWSTCAENEITHEMMQRKSFEIGKVNQLKIWKSEKLPCIQTLTRALTEAVIRPKRFFVDGNRGP